MSPRQLLLILLPFVVLVALGLLVMPANSPEPVPAQDRRDALTQSLTFAMVGPDVEVVKKEMKRRLDLLP